MKRAYTRFGHADAVRISIIYSLSSVVTIAAVLSIPIVGQADSVFPPVSRCMNKVHDKNKRTSLYAIKALGNWGTQGKVAIPDLMKMLRHKDLEIRLQASIALSQIGPNALPSLVEDMRSDDAGIRAWAVVTLGRMGPDAQRALPALVKSASDKEVYVRVSALQALMEIDLAGEEAEPILRQGSKDKDQYVSFVSQVGLQRLEVRRDKRAALGLKGPLLPVEPTLTQAQETVLDRLVDSWIALEIDATRAPDNDTKRSLWSAHHELALLLDAAGPVAIPAFVRGLQKTAVIGAGCPAAYIKSALASAIRRCYDPRRLEYLLDNINIGVPATPSAQAFARQIYSPLRIQSLQRKEELRVLTIIAAVHREQFTRLVLELDKQSDEEVRRALSKSKPELRLAALHIVAHRRLRCQDDLIRLLSDSQSRIVQAARMCLVRLARGTDFGPFPDDEEPARKLARNRWQTWWQFQDDNPKAIPVPDRLLHDTPKLTTKPANEAEAIAAQFLKAAPDRRQTLLDKLEKTKGIEYTDALAHLLAQLPESDRGAARDALARRLARMTARTLRDKFAEPDAEVRRAAARACALKEDREHVPDLIGLLADDDGEVCQAARAALRSLTGEDFGPKAEDDPTERRAIVKKWRAWWDKREER